MDNNLLQQDTAPKQTMGFSADASLERRIREYAKEKEWTVSKAISKLVEFGLTVVDEQKRPDAPRRKAA